MTDAVLVTVATDVARAAIRTAALVGLLTDRFSEERRMFDVLPEWHCGMCGTDFVLRGSVPHLWLAGIDLVAGAERTPIPLDVERARWACCPDCWSEHGWRLIMMGKLAQRDAARSV